MKKYRYDSECLNAEVEVAIDEEDTYAIIDDGIVKIIPNYHYLKNGKEVTYPTTQPNTPNTLCWVCLVCGLNQSVTC